jgi:hypothetical protein
VHAVLMSASRDLVEQAERIVPTPASLTAHQPSMAGSSTAASGEAGTAVSVRDHSGRTETCFSSTGVSRHA